MASISRASMTPQPAAALIASFDVLAEDRAGLERLFRTLTERIAFLMKGGEAPKLGSRNIRRPTPACSGRPSFPTI